MSQNFWSSCLPIPSAGIAGVHHLILSVETRSHCPGCPKTQYVDLDTLELEGNSSVSALECWATDMWCQLHMVPCFFEAVWGFELITSFLCLQSQSQPWKLSPIILAALTFLPPSSSLKNLPDCSGHTHPAQHQPPFYSQLGHSLLSVAFTPLYHATQGIVTDFGPFPRNTGPLLLSEWPSISAT